MIISVAYYRTSSAQNVGKDKDSQPRQEIACSKFAKNNKYKIIKSFYDKAISGKKQVMARPAFLELLEYCTENNIKHILVQDASRFSRDLIGQITGYEMLKSRGLTLIATDSPSTFVEDTPTATMIRNILGAVNQYQKDNLVAILQGARERKRQKTGKKVGGRQNYKEFAPKTVRKARYFRKRGYTLKNMRPKSS